MINTEDNIKGDKDKKDSKFNQFFSFEKIKGDKKDYSRGKKKQVIKKMVF